MSPIPSEWKYIFIFSIAHSITAQCRGESVFESEPKDAKFPGCRVVPERLIGNVPDKADVFRLDPNFFPISIARLPAFISVLPCAFHVQFGPIRAQNRIFKSLKLKFNRHFHFGAKTQFQGKIVISRGTA